MPTFQMPPQQKNEQGRIRKVGFEFEFNGLEIDRAAQIVADLFRGQQVSKNRFEYHVIGTAYGDFSIELDAALLKEQTYKKYLAKLGIDIADLVDPAALEEVLGKIASTVVPLEIVTPPIPLDRLPVLEDLRNALRNEKALGTKASFLYAFGLHMNPEAPSLTADNLLGYLRAFFLLYEWIHEESEIDFTRRLTPYINEFPEDYVLSVLDPDYNPNLEAFIADYSEWNPTRNRPLDMLPLLAMVDETLAERIEEDLLKTRPAFHYRLPNCLIDDPQWTVAREWNYWVAVEKLAGDPHRLQRLSKCYLEVKQSSPFTPGNRWLKEVKKWL